MSEERLEQVRKILSDVFMVDLAEVTVDSSPETIESWDSINHLNLVLSLEQEFGLSIDPNRIPELDSVRAIVDAVAAG